MTKIYIVRHAEAEGNLFRRIHGQTEGKVTENGKRQIEALEQRFSQIPVDVCLTSDLLRTRTTAQAVCRPNGLQMQPEPRFREVHLGCWEDVPFGQLYAKQSKAMEQFDYDPVNWKVEGSEPFSSYTSRFLEAMKEAAEQYRDGTICIVSHGAVIRGVLQTLFPHMPAGHSDNTAVTLLTEENGVYTPVYFNDNSHLSEEISTLAQQNWWRSEDGGKKDHNVWFQPGVQTLEDLTPVSSTYGWTAMLEERPVGTVCVEDRACGEAEVVYLGLVPHYRGKDLTIQLLGQAVYAMRKLGKKRLTLPVHTGLDGFCEKYGLCREDHCWSMDLTLEG